MVNKYVKGTKVMLGGGILFSSLDFDCHCTNPECTETLIDSDLVLALEALTAITKGITIDDGYRCEAHNAAVGGVEKSQHLLGKAADIKSDAVSPFGLSVMAYTITAFARGGMGIYNTFLHLDVRQGKARWDQRTAH